jgi:hypothetical protein
MVVEPSASPAKVRVPEESMHALIVPASSLVVMMLFSFLFSWLRLGRKNWRDDDFGAALGVWADFAKLGCHRCHPQNAGAMSMRKVIAIIL